ncbi:unnamed protein product [Onchocerca flexuosa]|uniref:Uncharacterized protein n=1 Tax=Onchocerca flexuosa TaxID=387005 RepID=A0A183H4C8_9BILA|nr:unnamed protein product [Onchocerca flexuosa]
MGAIVKVRPARCIESFGMVYSLFAVLPPKLHVDQGHRESFIAFLPFDHPWYTMDCLLRFCRSTTRS